MLSPKSVYLSLDLLGDMDVTHSDIFQNTSESHLKKHSARTAVYFWAGFGPHAMQRISTSGAPGTKRLQKGTPTSDKCDESCWFVFHYLFPTPFIAQNDRLQIGDSDYEDVIMPVSMQI